MLELYSFIILFSIQIILLTAYIPSLAIKRIKLILDQFPREQYPKLYPFEETNYDKNKHWFLLLNGIVAFIGLAIIIALLFSNPAELPKGLVEKLDMVTAIYFLFQLTPIGFLSWSEKNNLKAMRILAKNNKRSANFSKRNILNFVPVSWLFAAVALILFSIGMDFYLNFDANKDVFSVDNKTVHTSIVLLVTNALLFCVVYFNIYSKKLNPHQADADRLKHIEITAKSIVLMSIAMSLFFIVKAGFNEQMSDLIQAGLTSLYCAFVGYLSIGFQFDKINVNQINFDVYK